MKGLTKNNVYTPVSDESFAFILGKIENFVTVTDHFVNELRSEISEVTYKKGIHILNAGAKQPALWFILDGLLQEISVDTDTFAEETSWFWFKSNLVYAMPGFFDQEPSQVTIKVVKEARVAFLSYNSWRVLKKDFEESSQLIELVRSCYETGRKLHLKDINELSTTERYLKTEDKIDQLFPHIQLKYIAEYMGMSTDTLGKLRRKMVKLKKSKP